LLQKRFEYGKRLLQLLQTSEEQMFTLAELKWLLKVVMENVWIDGSGAITGVAPVHTCKKWG
jgi:hypothetical protein